MSLLVWFGFIALLAAPQAPAACNPAGNVQFVCGHEAPEDLVVVPGGDWVFASVFANNGGIRLVNTRDRTTTVAYPGTAPQEKLDARTYDTCPGPPSTEQKARFRTHGLALRAGRNSMHTL